MITGLERAEVGKLSIAQKRGLTLWHEGKAGREEGGRAWYPNAIRRLSLEHRLALAFDNALDEAWEARERLRVRRDLTYFTQEYGHVQPPASSPIPFDLWPEQADVLDDFLEFLRVLIVKARQLGMTWLALHFAFWLMAFNPETPNTKVLGLSKIGSDASKLVLRTRSILELLPPFMAPREDPDTRDSNKRLNLLAEPGVAGGGGEMLSLVSTPAAARSETAGLVLFDEMAFVRNGQAGDTLTAAEPTLGEVGRAIAMSTGNGDAGDGAAFAELCAKNPIDSPDAEWHKVFLPASTDPARKSIAWREKAVRRYQSVEDFEAEHPETEAQALASKSVVKVFPLDGIDAAERIGAELDRMLDDLIEDGCEWWIDWGDFMTHALYAIPLGGGGAYIFDELVQTATEPEEAGKAIIWHEPGGISQPIFTESFADSNPKGTNRTFARVLREARETRPDRFPEKHRTVPFSKYKEGGGEKKGVNTVKYVVRLLNAAADFDGEPAEAGGLLAVSPRCGTFLKQMRNLEKEIDGPRAGKVRKPSLDPRHPERGDHGPDAAIAGLALRAAKFKAEVVEA